MKKFLLIFFFAFSANAADLYQFDPYHTSITWSANHFGFSTVSGKFIGAEGKISIDEKNPKNSSLAVIINIDSLHTGIAKFDQHLRSKDFFDMENYPTAKFVSTSIVTKGKDRAIVMGDLTLHGVTKPVSLEMKLNKNGVGMMSQKKTLGFSGTTKIKRSDFGMEYALPGVSDMIDLHIESEIMLADATAATTPAKK